MEGLSPSNRFGWRENKTLEAIQTLKLMRITSVFLNSLPCQILKTSFAYMETWVVSLANSSSRYHSSLYSHRSVGPLMRSCRCCTQTRPVGFSRSTTSTTTEGQNAHNQVALQEHKADTSKREIDFEVGDVVGIAGNHWNG